MVNKEKELVMNTIINIEDYKKRKNDKIFSEYAFLRSFDFDNLRYEKEVSKNGILFSLNAYISPYDGRNLFFDVYNKDSELIKVFMVTEEEHYFVPNLDYYIWNKIDGDNVDNPVDKNSSYLEVNNDGFIDERDLLPPWDKANKNRFTMVKRLDYEKYLEPFNQIVETINSRLKDAFDKTIKNKS